MRVVHFYKHYLENGGMPRETYLLARAMARSPHVDCVFVYCLTPRRDCSEFEEDGIVVRPFWLPRSLYKLKWNILIPDDLRKYIAHNRDRADVFILTGSFIGEHFTISQILKRRGVPYVISIGAAFDRNTFVGLKGLKKRIWHLFFERDVIDHAVGIRLYSARQLADLERLGHTRLQAFIVKEGVDWDKIPLELRGPSPAVKQSPPIFGYLGRFEVWGKGLDLLLEAFYKYKTSGGSGLLRICGTSDSRGAIPVHRAISAYGLERFVEIIGPLYGPEKFLFLKSISMLCVPSRHEGIPRVVREAVAVGCPVMVTPHTNMHDLVAEYGAGIVVYIDPGAIAGGFRDFEGMDLDEKLLLSAGAVALSQQLIWERIAEEYVACLRELVG